MINQCPACDSPVADNGTLGYCITCGWEFVNFASPSEEGQKTLERRLAVTRNFLQELRKGNLMDKLEIENLRAALEEARELLMQKETEINPLREQIIGLKSELQQAYEDQNFIVLNQNYRGHKVKMEFWVSDTGDIHLEAKEPVAKLPTMTMIIKRGDVYVADPPFGSDGTYAGIIKPNMWRAKSQLLFTLESSQMSRIFPCLTGKFTFSLATPEPKFEVNRKGNENDLSNVQLKF